MPADLRPRKYPHFMEKEPERSRQSHKILGRLYDQVVKIDFVPCYELQFDDRILNAYTLSEDLLAAAKNIKAEYDAALHRILAQHDIHTEFEVYSTFVMHHSAAAKDYKFHEEIASIRDSLKDSFRKMVIERVGQRDEAKLGPFIAAMYTVTKQELDAALGVRKAKGKKRARTTEGNPPKFTPNDINEMPLISFPWLFPEILGRLANREHPFANIDTLDGSLKQYEYEHVALPDTKRGAARGTGANGTQSKSFEDEIYGFKRDDNTAAEDLAGLEIESMEYPGDDREAYIYFDYKEQEQQSPDCRTTGTGASNNENYHHVHDSNDNDIEANTPSDHKGELGLEAGTNGEENHYISHSENSCDGSWSILDNEVEDPSFCEQLFKGMHPGSDIF